MQKFNSLIPSALVNVEQAELHQSVGNEVVVQPDLLLTEQTQTVELPVAVTEDHLTSYIYTWRHQRRCEAECVVSMQLSD